MSNQNEEGLRLLDAEMKNFKNIGYKKIDVNGRSMIIIGPNQAGKSSLIQGMLSPVDAKYIPLEPVLQGEENGYTEITIGGIVDGRQQTYKVGLRFSPEHKRGRLTLFDGDGAQIKSGAKNLLDSVIGDISFNIMDFIKLGVSPTGKASVEGVKKQIEILKGLMPHEAVVELDTLDIERKKIYDERTDLNREVKYINEKIQKSGFKTEDFEKYTETKSTAEVNAKIEKSKKFNDAIDQSNKFVLTYPDDLKELDLEIASLEKRLEKAKADKDALEKRKVSVDEFLAKKPRKINVEEIEKMELSEIEQHNLNVLSIKELEKETTERNQKDSRANEITERIKAIDEQKKSIFSNAKMPVKGLSFDDDNVLFRGLPLSDGNIPTSQLIGIGLKIGMALNPNLRLLVIRDGSLLDNETMNFILSTCEKSGYQVIIEQVRHEGGDLEIKFIEE